MSAPHQELHRLEVSSVDVIFRPPRRERSHSLFGDSVGDGEGEALFFGHTRRRLPVLYGCPDYGHSKLFQLVEASLVGD